MFAVLVDPQLFYNTALAVVVVVVGHLGLFPDRLGHLMSFTSEFIPVGD